MKYVRLLGAGRYHIMQPRWEGKKMPKTHCHKPISPRLDVITDTVPAPQDVCGKCLRAAKKVRST